MMSDAWLSIIGIGEDGWDGLNTSARCALEDAELLVGSARQLALVPHQRGERIAWPSPMLPFVDELLARERGRAVAVLASGDPMLCGVGAIFAKRLDACELRVIPQVSAFTLACARLAWPSAEVTLVSAVARPLARIVPHLAPGSKMVIFSEDGTTPERLAALLVQHGYGASALHIFEHLGAPRERRIDAVAATYAPERVADLNLVAVTCVADAWTRPLASVPGLPDDAFEHDGQLTKRDVRAASLARLVPLPGALLWDVGAGSGAIGIEWMRVHPSCRAIAFERDPQRAVRIARNAERLGVPGLRIVAGAAPAAFAGIETPDAIFIGGGIGGDGLLDACLDALAPNGRLVANVVTVEGEVALARAHAAHGGELTRTALAHAAPIGSMLTWRPALPITQWTYFKNDTVVARQ
jgi:precorrin-6Y C5,15-methyltransferase (decarboxylating)